MIIRLDNKLIFIIINKIALFLQYAQKWNVNAQKNISLPLALLAIQLPNTFFAANEEPRSWYQWLCCIKPAPSPSPSSRSSSTLSPAYQELPSIQEKDNEERKEPRSARSDRSPNSSQSSSPNSSPVSTPTSIPTPTPSEWRILLGEPSPMHMSAKKKTHNQRVLRKLQTKGMVYEYEKGKTIIIFPHTASASALLETTHIWGRHQRDTNRQARRIIGKPRVIPTVTIDHNSEQSIGPRPKSRYPFNREHWERTPCEKEIEDHKINNHIENLRNPQQRWIPQSYIDDHDGYSDEIPLQLPPHILKQIRRNQSPTPANNTNTKICTIS